jgi:hypothetical protein
MAYKDEIHHHIIKRVNPAIIALIETRLTKEIKDCEINDEV